jgi:NhaA family Na+:H+ antiporter
VHATLAGVVMAFLVPATPALSREIVTTLADELHDVFTPEAARETSHIARRSVSQLEWIEHQLHPWSSLLIVPVFALANAGVTLTSDSLSHARTSTVTWGVIIGLVVGKALGVTGGAALAQRAGLADRPDDLTSRHIAGAAALAGIGFTVSLFITGLAFDDPRLVDDAKIGILVASILASGLGALLLRQRQAATTSPNSSSVAGGAKSQNHV